MGDVDGQGDGEEVPTLKVQPAVSTATTVTMATSNNAVFLIMIIIACAVIVDARISVLPSELTAERSALHTTPPRISSKRGQPLSLQVKGLHYLTRSAMGDERIHDRH